MYNTYTTPTDNQQTIVILYNLPLQKGFTNLYTSFNFRSVCLIVEHFTRKPKLPVLSQSARAHSMPQAVTRLPTFSSMFRYITFDVIIVHNTVIGKCVSFTLCLHSHWPRTSSTTFLTLSKSRCVFT